MAVSGDQRSAYDAVVVGAGPAGLSAAAELAAAGTRCLVVEQGRSHRVRDRRRPADILSGVGGAGLFSDGKHSFHPAATELWRLPDREALEHAYRETARLLARYGVVAPPFPDDGSGAPAAVGDGGWSLKRYPSIYASLEDRTRCIAALHDACGELPSLDARVVSSRRIGALFAIDVLHDGATRTLEARSLIVATGRLSPRFVRPILEPLGVRFELRRLEIGVRLEVGARSPLFARLEMGVDPKLSYIDADGTEYRSFCTCRDGETVVGETHGIEAVSGRADVAPTGRSSIGLLARITEERLVRAIEHDVFASKRPAWRAPLADVLAGAPVLAETFGVAGSAIVRRALARFVDSFAVRDDDAIVAGPCIEGVGDYPASDPHLAIAPGVFVAGDACGRFRGLIASMVSGRYVAFRLSRATPR